MSEEDWDRVLAVNLKVVISEPVTCARPQPWEGLGGGLPPQLFLQALSPSRQGTFLVTQAAAQALVSSGCRGSIINISSIIGKVRLSWAGPASHVGTGKRLP